MIKWIKKQIGWKSDKEIEQEAKDTAAELLRLMKLMIEAEVEEEKSKSVSDNITEFEKEIARKILEPGKGEGT